VEIKYTATAGHLLPISKIHAMQVQESCAFNIRYSACMNTFYSLLHVAYISSARFEVSR